MIATEIKRDEKRTNFFLKKLLIFQLCSQTKIGRQKLLISPLLERENTVGFRQTSIWMSLSCLKKNFNLECCTTGRLAVVWLIRSDPSGFCKCLRAWFAIKLSEDIRVLYDVSSSLDDNLWPPRVCVCVRLCVSVPCVSFFICWLLITLKHVQWKHFM